MPSFKQFMKNRESYTQHSMGRQRGAARGGRQAGSRVPVTRSAYAGGRTQEPSREPEPTKTDATPQAESTKEAPTRGAEGLEGGPAKDPSLGADEHADRPKTGKQKLAEHFVGSNPFANPKTQLNIGLGLVSNLAMLSGYGVTGSTLAAGTLISTLMNPSTILGPMAMHSYKQHQAVKEYAKNLTDEEMGELADVLGNKHRDFESLPDNIKQTFDQITNNQRHIGQRKTHFDPFAKPGRQATVTKSEFEKNLDRTAGYAKELDQNVAASGPEARFNEMKEHKMTAKEIRDIQERNEAFEKQEQEKRNKAAKEFREKEKERAGLGGRDWESDSRDTAGGDWGGGKRGEGMAGMT
jgi:hypothetical protein